MRRLNRGWLTAAILACLTWAVFAPALDCGFVNLDDFTYVYRNRYVTNGLSVEGIRWAFTTYQAANWHPLTWLSLQLDNSLWGSGPRGFHRTNVFIHGLNAALLFLVLRRLTGDFWRSAAVALLFAVHPLRVESVAWISERKDVLSVFFGLLALGAYAAYVDRRSMLRYLAVALALTLSLLCKPMLVTLPFLMLVLDWWPLRRVPTKADTAGELAAVSGRNPGSSSRLANTTASSKSIAEKPAVATQQTLSLGRTWQRLFVEKIPLFALVAASSVIAYTAQADQGAVMELDRSPLPARLANALVSYSVYMAQTVWPTNLAALYAHPESSVRLPETIASGLLLVAFTGVALVFRRRTPYVLTGWLWYLGTLVPVIGLVQVGLQAHADRYTHFPQIGLLIALCWGVADIGKKRLPAVATAGAVAAAALAALTVQQIGVWHDSLTLWQHSLRTAGESATAYANLAETFENMGQIEKATHYYRESLRLAPDVVQGHVNLGNILQKQNRLDEAAKEFESIIKIAPARPEGYTLLGLIRRRQKRFDEAEHLLREASERRPESEKSEGYVNQALLEEERENYPLAAEYFRDALNLNSIDPKAHAGLGVALLHLGAENEEQGLKELRESIRLDPGFARGYELLGKALWARKDLDGAASQFEREILVSPKPATPWYNLGKIRGMQQRYVDAAECFAKSLEYYPYSDPCRKALAVALDYLRKDGQSERANQIEQRVLHLISGPAGRPPDGSVP